MAYELAPYRRQLEKDQCWRANEQELQTLLARQHSARRLQYPLTH